ncbi:MAG: hypothetical protein D6722_17990 [Bacteroidetes bacterium]|nr:MAG: hypothetical protein D6722_17990 [Bacteroidota bacterium]
MHLELNLSGRELSDDMLKDLQQFLRDHTYEGLYEISIRTVQQEPASRRPRIIARPRQEPSASRSANAPAGSSPAHHKHIRIRPRQ